MKMNSKIKGFTNAILNKQNFAMIYIALLALRSVFLLQKYVDFACKLCLIWGILIVLSDVFIKKLDFFKAKNSILPLVLCIAFTASVFVNFKYALYGGIKNLMYLVIYLFVLFAVETDTPKKDFLRYFKRNNDVFIIVNFLITIASLFTFILNIKFIHVVDGSFYKVGFWFNRLNGVSNCNTATIFALISLCLCFVNYLISENKLGKKIYFYILNVVVNFIYYVLSGSRAATVCYIIIFVCAAVFIMYPKLRQNKSALKSIGSMAMCFVIILPLVYVLKLGTQKAMEQVRHAVSSIVYQGDYDAEEEEIDFSRIEDFEDFENSGITNNRANMWRAALKIVKEKPFFGIAYADPLDANKELRADLEDIAFNAKDMSGIKAARFYFHNGYIQIILCGGIIFAVAFLIFAVLQIYKYFKYLIFSDKNILEYKIIVAISTVLVILLIDNLVEVHLLFNGQDGIASEFWYLLGMGAYFLKKAITKSKTSKIQAGE